MVDPEARSSEKEHGQAKKEGAVGSIRGLVSDNIPALRPEHRAFVVVNGVWVPESRSWVLSCGFVDETIRPR